MNWDLGCGHFDSYGDPKHDCSKWGTKRYRFKAWLIRLRWKYGR